MAKIVIALGGNALGDTAAAQLDKCAVAAKTVVDLYEGGNELMICHGNGPQVGMIRLAFENAAKQNGGGRVMPFPECTAMSQGYIGFHLQQSISNELAARGADGVDVATIVTQIVIDEGDPAFLNPTKPIGSFYDEDTAKTLMEQTGDKYIEDSGRGWRRVVPSPKPIDIYEKSTLRTLFGANRIIIASGGGGIPIAQRGNRYVGIDAVVDKDFAGAKLADIIGADMLFILTDIDQAYLNFLKPNQSGINKMTVTEARRYISENHFAPGSMLPKVEASCQFVSGGGGRRAVIGALTDAVQALRGIGGTTIVA